MSESTIVEIALAAIGGLFTILWYLLQQKDEKQQKDIDDMKAQHAQEIATLWSKHDSDVDKLRELELQIASQHYIKPELDAKFERIEDAMRQGFVSMTSKIDELIKVFMQGKQ